MNKSIEDVVEEFKNIHPAGLHVNCGIDKPEYKQVFDEELEWLKESLTSLVQKERERIRENLTEICNRNNNLMDVEEGKTKAMYAKDISEALSNTPKT